MLSKELLFHFEKLLSEKIIGSTPLSGGDINQVYVLNTGTQKIVAKVNKAIRFSGMFSAEAEGLKILRESNSFVIPEVFYIGELDTHTFLLLEFIEEKQYDINLPENFAIQLAQLHQSSASFFGFKIDNYIGSLPQYNTSCQTASDFYIMQRLQPQFKLAREKGYFFKREEGLYKQLENSIPNEKSSLIHGDLWSGNYMIQKNGAICLIDPAVAYAPREMDLGMMHLFGGFPSKLFDVYNEALPLVGNWRNRLPIWQLYYLLVHLNLFGSSYYTKVKEVMKQYSE